MKRKTRKNQRNRIIRITVLVGGVILLCSLFACLVSLLAYEHGEEPDTASKITPTKISNNHDNASEETSPFAETFVSSLTGASLNGELMLEQRTTIADSFYYEPLSASLQDYITGISYPADTAPDTLAITYDDLRYVHVLHYDFQGNVAEGELICNKAIANDLTEIFHKLYNNQYPVEKIRLIDEYAGDDTASMEDNNTSCFNYRTVPGSTSMSKHSLGLAIDVNPLYNPYVTYNQDGSENVSPANGTAYADRTTDFLYKIDENDLCFQLFKEYGFTWGGSWNSVKDYQHFQKYPVE